MAVPKFINICEIICHVNNNFFQFLLEPWELLDWVYCYVQRALLSNDVVKLDDVPFANDEKYNMWFSHDLY